MLYEDGLELTRAQKKEWPFTSEITTNQEVVMTTQQKLVQKKLTLQEPGEYLQNLSEVCRLRLFSRTTLSRQPQQ